MKFSVIIPVHNAEKTIERCIDSLFLNTFQDMEIIAVEDGSKDRSWEILKGLAGKYSRLKIFRNAQNRGVSYTRNQGLINALGEYICFTDSDDWVEKDYLERFSETLILFPQAFPICGYVNHDKKYGGRTDEVCFMDIKEVQLFRLKEKLEELHQKTLLQQLWNKVFRGDVIRRNNIHFDESISIGEDFRFILSYLQFAEHEQVALINASLYHYMRDQAGSLMYTVGRESVEEAITNQKMLNQILDLSESESESRIEKERKRLIDLYAYLIMHNVGMKRSEKKRLIQQLDKDQGVALFKKNEKVYFKEKVKKMITKS